MLGRHEAEYVQEEVLAVDEHVDQAEEDQDDGQDELEPDAHHLDGLIWRPELIAQGDVQAATQLERGNALAERLDRLPAGQVVNDRLDDAWPFARQCAQLGAEAGARYPHEDGYDNDHGGEDEQRDPRAAPARPRGKLVNERAEDVRQNTGDDEGR